MKRVHPRHPYQPPVPSGNSGYMVQPYRYFQRNFQFRYGKEIQWLNKKVKAPLQKGGFSNQNKEKHSETKPSLHK